jgi:predicted RNA-binding protein with PUA-like domain
MVTLRRGNRLSITPVTAAEWRIVEKLADAS